MALDVTGISSIDAAHKTITLVATDRYGKPNITNGTFTVLFDDEAPVIKYTPPGVSPAWYAGNGLVQFSGALSDNKNRQLQKVYYHILTPGVSTPPAIPSSPLDLTKQAAALSAGWKEAAVGSSNWTVSPDLLDPSFLEGKNILYLIAFDEACNCPDADTAHWSGGSPTWTSVWLTGTPQGNTAACSIEFGIDRRAPTSAINFYKDSDTGKAAALANNAYLNESFSFEGSVTDANNLASVEIYQKHSTYTDTTGNGSAPDGV